ncbi:MAG: DUF2961 domain-containing protein [Planctomycetes bacterium]|nr:DUF2961 domain-containing protein [Planctomycetota bacterium]
MKLLRCALFVALSILGVACAAPARRVTVGTLLAEMTDAAALARLPEPTYRSLQASSYNRESVGRDQPGWFADSDGTGFLREETNGGAREWVLMEHDGPGCLTRLWTPFFYYDFGERVGPNVRVYLDGASEPVLDESLIRLVRGEGSLAPPFAAPTARAGDLYLPIPFAKGCKITLRAKPFYFLVNYRAYAGGTEVESFRADAQARYATELARAAALLRVPEAAQEPRLARATLQPGAAWTLEASRAPGCIRALTLRLPGAAANPALLRSTVLSMNFDGEECVWCPLGDFFCSADEPHPFTTLQRDVAADGRLRSRWTMPFARSAEIRIENLAAEALEVELELVQGAWDWDARSLHFHATWRPDEIVSGAEFHDWNFVDVTGAGVYVGDAWTVLNPQRNTWWGEGDEKIYVDDAWERGFPTHFGTGSEDYYGWAGGEVPTRRDEFSHPFLANVRVGGLDGTTQGYNICTRTRALDAIPFARRLRFDMEASPGTDIRGPEDQLGYSAVSFWYARPGATHNRPALPEEARRRIMRLAANAAGRTLVVQ